MNKTIDFSELKTLSDNIGLVMTGYDLFNTSIEAVDEWLHEVNLISEDKKVTHIYYILGNVKGSHIQNPDIDARMDFLVQLTSEGNINPFVRLRYSDIKWISDFYDNYKCDYQLPSYFAVVFPVRGLDVGTNDDWTFLPTAYCHDRQTALDLYANTPVPASMLITGYSAEDLNWKIKEVKTKFTDPEFIKELLETM